MRLGQLYLLLKEEGITCSDFDWRQLAKKHFDRTEVTTLLEEEKIPLFRHDLQQLIEGYPLQYLLGEWEFYGLPFVVGEGVLIPRQDTETIIDCIRELIPQRNYTFADFCAGSGAIAVTLAHYYPQSTGYALELSEEALPYLTQNIKLNKVEDRVQILVGDAFNPPPLPPLDLLVSNPPYIVNSVVDNLEIQLSHEPRMALEGGKDGLDFYRSITKTAKNLLKKDGLLVFEIGYDQELAVVKLLEEAGFSNVHCEKDYGGNPRCVWGRKS